MHRIGRTARAASKGTAYTFVTDKELYKFRKIEKLLGKEVPPQKVPEQFGPTPQPGAASDDRPKKSNNKKRNWKKRPGGGGNGGGGGKPKGNRPPQA